MENPVIGIGAARIEFRKNTVDNMRGESVYYLHSKAKTDLLSA